MTAQDGRVAQACYDAGFRDDALRTIVAIAAAESNCDPDIAPTDTRSEYDVPGDGYQPEYSVGVFRINLMAHPEITYEQAADIREAATLAYMLFRERGDYDAWSVFSYIWDDANRRLDYVGYGRGAYRNYLGRADDAIALVTTQGETIGFDARADGTVDVVAVGSEPDGRIAIGLTPEIIDLVRDIVLVLNGDVAGLSTDTGTAAQRAAMYNMQRTGTAFLSAFGVEI